MTTYRSATITAVSSAKPDPLIKQLEYLAEPDSIMPVQFDAVLDVAREPEKAIRIALLRDVICLFTHAAEGGPSTRLYNVYAVHDAVVWIASDDWQWPYSFCNVCQALGLEVPTARRALLKLLSRPGAKPTRSVAGNGRVAPAI